MKVALHKDESVRDRYYAPFYRWQDCNGGVLAAVHCMFK